ncbi:hypothetical protein EPUS_04560 [Endocarpon pusillum Z07020]|uniref:Uncharacterized protein n=1 Tax=Endocarpon pusillum (strain Z07020 / HMAS-L-300199) TaxID=1263415 RepID=U1HXM6_ENDPU|nr:uncharacterized protein EPUS_04560 [Endocarpon pusillum Z07020]ERF75580.1 hypothetical protein EPUS_04560 [Endocarpon pusillum Z07020]
MSSKPVQLLRNTKDPVVSSKGSRDPHRSVQASAQPGKGSSPSPSRPQNRITNPAPATKAKPFTQALSAAETLTRGGPLASDRYYPLTPGLPDDDPNDPLNLQIRSLIWRNKERDGRKGYLNVIRATLLEYASLSYDEEANEFTDKYDLHIKQLVRVLDELKKWGHCTLGGQVVRPG